MQHSGPDRSRVTGDGSELAAFVCRALNAGTVLVVHWSEGRGPEGQGPEILAMGGQAVALQFPAAVSADPVEALLAEPQAFAGRLVVRGADNEPVVALALQPAPREWSSAERAILQTLADHHARAHPDPLPLHPAQRQMAQALPHIAWSARADGTVDYLSEAFCRITGFEAGDLSSGAWLDALHAADRVATTAAWNAAVAAADGFEAQLRLFDQASRTYRWHVMAARPQKDPAGRVLRWFGTMSDVDEQKQAESDLAQRRGQTRAILETISEGILGLDLEGCLIFENEAARELLGASSEMLRGKRMHPFVTGLWHDPATMPEADSPICQVLADGQPRSSDRAIFCRADGHRFHASYTCKPMYNRETGEATGLVLNFQDVTERHFERSLPRIEATILRMVADDVPLETVFKGLCAEVETLLSDALVAVMLTDEDGRLYPVAAPSLAPGFTAALQGMTVADGRGLNAAAAFRGSPVVVTDTASDPLTADFADLWTRHGLRAAWSLPVLGEGGKVLATLGVYHRQLKTPTDAEIDLIRRLGQYVRLAVERTRERYALRESEKRHRSLFNMLPASVWEQDISEVEAMVAAVLAGGVTDFARWLDENPAFVERALKAIKVTDVNDHALLLHGFETREALMEMFRTAPRTPASMAAFKTDLVALARGERTRETEYQLVRRDGTVLDLMVVYSRPVAQPGRLLFAEVDITARKRAEERFQLIARISGDVIWDIDLAQDVVWWSDGLLRNFGHDPAALGPGLAGWRKLVHPHDLAATEALVQAALDGGDEEIRGQFRLQRADGEYAHVEGVARIVRDDSGTPVRLAGVFADTTARKLAEERFRVVAQTTSDVVYDHDLLTGKIWVSDGPRRAFGYADETFYCERDFWIDAIHPDERDEVLARADAAVHSDLSEWSHEYRLARADGSYADVRENAIFMRDENGKAFRMIGSFNDLTETKRLEQMLRQSQRLDAVGQLTGGIAHDFNNLLTVILGNVELLAEGAPADSREKELAYMALKAAERGAELTARLLAFARKQPLAPRSENVNIIVAELSDMIRRTMTPSITLELAPGKDLWPSMVDVSQLENALLNLCLNARDAMPEGGCLIISTVNHPLEDPAAQGVGDLAPGDYIAITVKDTGVGMDEETQARAFEPFFSTKPVGAGTGLGLSMIYGFVKQSQGAIRVNSAPGKGTSVQILLPRAELAPRPRAPAPEDTGEKVGRGRILLVEDEEFVRRYVVSQLEKMGYEVDAAENASGALSMLENGRFDLLMTDIVMPGAMNGRQLAEVARQKFPDLPVLYMSGHSRDEIIREGHMEGTIHFLQKPFRRPALVQKLREALTDAPE